jgi:putative phosphoesterase
MRIALISDIHANAIALDAVLADAHNVGVDFVVCLGDVATLGPHPREVIDTLRELDCPCIMGNHDEFLIEPELVTQYTQVPVIVDAIDWCRRQLDDRDLDYLRGFNRRLEIPLDDSHRLLLFHGSPESHMKDLLATTPVEELDACLGGHVADVMACGHTHIQMLRQHRGTLLVNPGSVGMPFEEYVSGARPTIMPYAEYAVVGAVAGRISVELRRVDLDKSALRSAAASWPNPPRLLRDDLLLQYA